MMHQIKVISEFPVDTDITIGSVFYGVEHVESQTFGAVCKICDGEGKVNIRGSLFTCPECWGKKPEERFRGFAVRAFRVYGVEVLEQVRKGKLERIQVIRLVDSEYYGKDMTDANKRYARPSDLDMDLMWELSYADVETAIFSTWERAVAYADKLRAAEIKRMAEFNEKYGTVYKLEWRIKDVMPIDNCVCRIEFLYSLKNSVQYKEQHCISEKEDEGKCWGNGDCQECPKAKWSSSELFTEEPRVIGCMEDEA